MFPFLLLGLPLSDLDRFPEAWEANVQVERCREHVQRLRFYRYAGGHEKYGHLDQAIVETREMQGYWEMLALVHELSGERRQGQLLLDFRELIGPHKYYSGWHPLLLPVSEKFADPVPVAIPPAGP